MREIDLQALIQSIEAEQRAIESLRKTIEADRKERQQSSETDRKERQEAFEADRKERQQSSETDRKERQEAFEADRKARQEMSEKIAKAAEESNRKWDDLRELQIQSIQRMDRSIDKSTEKMEKIAKAAEESNRKWDELRELHVQSIQRMERSVEQSTEESNRKWDELRELQVQSIQRMERSIDKSIAKAVNQIAGLFTTQWGQLVESLVEPGCVEQFRKIGIDISRTMQRIERADPDGRQMEIDVLLVNGKEIVAVEVKAKLKVANVEKHEENLGRFREVFQEYQDKEVLGAVAALSFDSDSDKYAWRRGMFVLKPEQGLVQIANGADFLPKRF